MGFVGSCARWAAALTVAQPKTAAALERSEQRVDVLDGADEEVGVVELGLTAVAPSHESSADAQWTRTVDVVVAVAPPLGFVPRGHAGSSSRAPTR